MATYGQVRKDRIPPSSYRHGFLLLSQFGSARTHQIAYLTRRALLR